MRSWARNLELSAQTLARVAEGIEIKATIRSLELQGRNADENLKWLFDNTAEYINDLKSHAGNPGRKDPPE